MAASPATLADALADAFDRYGPLLDQNPNLAAATAVGTAAPEDGPVEAVTPPKVDLTGIVRPNGETYLPRQIKKFDTTDVAMVQTAYENKMPVLLYGPPGTGKTALVEAALPNLVTMVGTNETETADFIGSWVQKTDGTYTWVDAPFIVAADNGWPFLIDEIALIDPRVLSIVYSVMDGRDEINVVANPERGIVKAKPGFVVYGACNPDVPGAVMSDALLSRFKLHIGVTTDWDLARKLGVGTKIITVARNLETKFNASEVVAPPQLREVLTYNETVKVFGEAVALSNFIAQARPEDRPTFAEVIKSTFGTEVASLTI